MSLPDSSPSYQPQSGRFGLTLASPWLVTLLLFWLFPLGYSLYLSFTDYHLLRQTTNWVGWENYTTLLSDPAFLAALKNTLLFTVITIPLTQIIAIGLALLVNRNFPGRSFFRSAFFIPSITSMVVVALVFTNLYSRGGYIISLAELVGFTPPENGFLLDSSTALYSIMAMDIWMASGYYMLLALAGLKAVPVELYEAATINGAGRVRQFFSITLPLLKPIILFSLVINGIKSLQVFVEIFVMTSGKYNTSTGVYYVYESGLKRFTFGEASAAAYILFLIIAVFSVIQFAAFRNRRALG
ncbi:MAG: sugar ABC transporter permease [candidate division Zixibacteria bacterium]|nr:sugar ABC transporter permease [candidate division Zixibacteria bacterium]